MILEAKRNEAEGEELEPKPSKKKTPKGKRKSCSILLKKFSILINNKKVKGVQVC